MITVLASPKRFIDSTKTLQDNAINSWIKQFGKENICLFGDNETKENSDRLGVNYDRPETNESGLPLINSIFNIARNRFSTEYFLFINSDIILLSDLKNSVEMLSKRFMDGFLLIGRRTNLDVKEIINFSNKNIECELREQASRNGKLVDLTSIDYFLFPHDSFKEIPPLRVGRAGYDNIIIFWAKKHEKIAVVDGTKSILAIHQNHNYGHVNGGKNEVYLGREAKENIAMVGNNERLFFINESDYKIANEKIIKNHGPKYYMSKRYLFNVLPAMYPIFYPLILLKRIWLKFRQS